MIARLRHLVPPGKPDWIRLGLFGAALTACLLIIYRYELANGFRLIPGDSHDSIIQAAILEHWHNVLLGRANWTDAGYFYPHKWTIAQTDAYFLIGLAYFPFRLLGFDPFLSAELTGLFIKPIGFIGAYILARKALKASFWWCLLAAVLFTLSNGMTSHSYRLQLSSVAFAPLLGWLVWETVDALLAGKAAKFRLLGALSGLLFGALCLTCLYIAWFFAFFTVFLLLALGLIHFRGQAAAPRSKPPRMYGSLVLVMGITLLALAPSVYMFLSKSQEVGVRSYHDALAFTVPVSEILQTGSNNLSSGRLYNSLLSYLAPGYKPGNEYSTTGFSIPLFILFVLGCALVLRTRRLQQEDSVLAAAVIATISTWLLVLNFWGWSGWYLVFSVFPGAKALRAVATYQIFLALPVVIIAVRWLSRQGTRPLISILLAGLLIACELNQPYLRLNRNLELRRASVTTPPAGCRVFYVSGWSGQEGIGESPYRMDDLYAHNVTAIFIAQELRIPTINGFASFNPPDWNFGFPNHPDYDQRVRAYAQQHEIKGLCKLDLNTKRWQEAGLP